MIDLTVHNVDEIIGYFSREVNNLLFDPKEIAEEQREKPEMQDLDLCWIKILSSKDYRTDLRNEASARTGRQLAEISFVKRKIELVDNQKMEAVAGEMAMEHRTLQQTFSGLVFYHFLLACNNHETQILFKEMGESFYHLPFV